VFILLLIRSFRNKTWNQATNEILKWRRAHIKLSVISTDKRRSTSHQILNDTRDETTQSLKWQTTGWTTGARFPSWIKIFYQNRHWGPPNLPWKGTEGTFSRAGALSLSPSSGKICDRIIEFDSRTRLLDVKDKLDILAFNLVHIRRMEWN
jgi:hypothetical protein